MLNARTIIIGGVALASIILLAACWSLLAPKMPDSGSDSFGVRADGYRGLYEVLEELSAPVERRLAPPTAKNNNRELLALLGPHQEVVDLEPAHMQGVRAWLQGGGQVVLALSNQRDIAMRREQLRNRLGEAFERRSMLQLLGLPRDVRPLTVYDRADAEQAEDTDEETNDWLFAPAEPLTAQDVAVSKSGDWSNISADVRSLAVPEGDVQTLDVGGSKPAATIHFQASESTPPRVLAARYRIGRGELVVIADARLVQNYLIARADNAVLAAGLFIRPDQTTAFDEFYHGLTVRGNPVWLLTRPPFRALALAGAAALGLAVWRRGVSLGPPLAGAVRSRRTIVEYIEAMSRLFAKSRRNRPFLLTEVRDGVLWFLGRRLQLPPGQETVERLVAAIERKDKSAAVELSKAVEEVNRSISAGRAAGDAVVIAQLKRMQACL